MNAVLPQQYIKMTILERTYVDSVCKRGKGAKCCRYLMFGAEGFECAKLTDIKAHLDDRVKNETIVARGDNCIGVENKLIEGKKFKTLKDVIDGN